MQALPVAGKPRLSWTQKRQPLIVVARELIINLYVLEGDEPLMLADQAKTGQFDGPAAFGAADEPFDGFDVLEIDRTKAAADPFQPCSKSLVKEGRFEVLQLLHGQFCLRRIDIC